jgi:hypothetical protein
MTPLTRIGFVLVGLSCILFFAALAYTSPTIGQPDKLEIACIATLEFIGAFLLMFGVLGKNGE